MFSLSGMPRMLTGSSKDDAGESEVGFFEQFTELSVQSQKRRFPRSVQMYAMRALFRGISFGFRVEHLQNLHSRVASQTDLPPEGRSV